jgi:serine phosphatase RsbU (regulator of sigma subunit)
VRPVQASSRQGYAYVVDQKGHLVFHPGVNPDEFSVQSLRRLVGVPRQLDYSGVSIIRRLRAGVTINGVTLVRDDPHEREPQLASAARVPGADWWVVVQQPRAAVMRPVEVLAAQLWGGTILVVLLALVLAAGIAVMDRRMDALEQRLTRARFEYQLGLERAQRDADMAIGQQIQQSLLRREEVPGAEIECYSQPAREVGGDFYSVFPLDARRQGILVGDVTGKGVKAALYMTVATTLLQTLARREPSPARVLAAANADLVPTMHRLKMFVTALYAVLDLETNTLTFANAGHLPPLLRRGDTVREADLPGLPLGAVEGADYQDETIALEPGDAVVLYSDGYVEALDENNEMLGFEGLREVVRRGRAGSAANLMADLLAAWQHATGGRPQHDDLTLVVVRHAATAAPAPPPQCAPTGAGRV